MADNLGCFKLSHHLHTTMLPQSWLTLDNFNLAPIPLNNDFTTVLADRLTIWLRRKYAARPNNDFISILADRFGRFTMAPAPPNSDFIPILTDRFGYGCFISAPAIPTNDFTSKLDGFGRFSEWRQHLPTATLPQSLLTRLIASNWRQHLPTTALPHSRLTGSATNTRNVDLLAG